ncbi:MAG: hypothetical protein HZB38_16890 [Planctomycetes bacterium]|nr:hypothetical protein [Planctomycetota bacterium]
MRLNTEWALEVGDSVLCRFDALPLDRDGVRRAIGLRPSTNNGARWEKAIDELEKPLRGLARGRALIRIEPVASLQSRRLTLAHGPVIEGAVGQFLAHSQLVALFIATIGSGVERLSRRWLRNGNVVRGLVADAIASELAESAAFLAQQAVRAWALSHQMDITPRYSPGYCGMSVRQQTVLFSELPARQIGVQLSASCLMTPVKSVSGIIGIAPASQVTPEDYPCGRCDHPNCMQRRVPFESRRGSCVDWSDCGVPPPPTHETEGD